MAQLRVASCGAGRLRHQTLGLWHNASPRCARPRTAELIPCPAGRV